MVCHPKSFLLKSQKCVVMSLWQLSHIDLSSVLRVWLCDCSLLPLTRPSDDIYCYWYLGRSLHPVLICILLPDPPLPPYSGSGASHAGLSRGAETQLQDTGDTGSFSHTLSPLQSSEHAAEKCTCVLCSGNIAKNVLFSRKIWPDISFCQQSCIALHYYIFCFALGILID